MLVSHGTSWMNQLLIELTWATKKKYLPAEKKKPSPTPKFHCKKVLRRVGTYQLPQNQEGRGFRLKNSDWWSTFQHSAVLYICYVEARLAENVGGKGPFRYSYCRTLPASLFYVSIWKASAPFDLDAPCVSSHPWTFSVCLTFLHLATFPSVSTLLLIHAAGGSASEPACVSLPGRQPASSLPVWGVIPTPVTGCLYSSVYLWNLWLNYHLFYGEAWFGAKWVVVYWQQRGILSMRTAFLIRVCSCRSEKKHRERL